ncbi:MAG: hypothetical protein HYR85_19925 [Planctomycetes bacterium]|nr:hypothetical protein [Planctomycetota bacterium]MBI3844498.1 hypothetical protein [Planctomycetota bacterium]
MSHVYVLGAGASREYVGRLGRPFFLDFDFFKTVEIVDDAWPKPGLPIHYDGSRWSSERLKRALLDGLGRPLNEIGLEAAFTFVEKNRPKLLDDFTRCIELAIFVHLGNLQSRDALSTHLAFVRALRSGDTIVTFNYDPLIESALMIGSPEDIRWNPDRGYAIEFERVLEGFEQTVATGARPVPNVTVLKLHGSMNWMAPVGAWPARPHCLRVFSMKDGIPDLRGIGFKIWTDPVTHQRLRPVFVPPRELKDYDVFGLRPVWDAAESKLRQASGLTVIGYSFPETDRAAVDLLANEANHLRDSTEVTFVTKHDRKTKHENDAATRFLTIFPNAVVCDDGFAGYVANVSSD